MVTQDPDFARAAGLTALKWLSLGRGYEIEASDVHEAFDHTMMAARKAIQYIQQLTRPVEACSFTADILR